MIIKLLKTALVAGLVAGVFGWTLQMALTTPIIIAAEAYEDAPADGAAGGETHTHEDGSEHVHDAEAWAPEDGIERHAFTLLTSVLFGVGFAAILAACYLMNGSANVGWRRGLVWGLLGYAAVFLAPALGLPPELPGMAAADLMARQGWWLAAVVLTAGGLIALIKGQSMALRLLGLVLIVAPHAWGAPHAGYYSDGPPAELAAHFAVASLVSVALFWMMLGAASGWAWDRFNRAA
ncbi:MAG: CbtA family protein [Rhodospirillales bacterium]